MIVVGMVYMKFIFEIKKNSKRKKLQIFDMLKYIIFIKMIIYD